ncbi:hypothetical protein [Hyalangium gracile]|uniref:hypothetical protein n=1 Tax=Hyalangium gracile TaxID=394092 RepID=UPI001CCF9440|nr:hypothetical protein [Hyalangium gracile]
MLYALENLLAAALDEAFPDDVKVSPGAPTTTPAAGEQRVEVTVSKLDVLPAGEDPLAAREPAFFSSVQRWDADGTTRDFTLPAGVEGEVTEVESPAGRMLSRGQDYQVDGTTLRFYRPPAKGKGTVVATLRTGAASGFHERRPCQLRLTLAAWAPKLEDADALLDKALAVVLTRCAGLGTLESEHLEDSGVRMRLRQPKVLLEGFERTRTQVRTRWAPRAAAHLRVLAELELTVATGAPEPQSRIEKILYQATVLPPR